jgi:hypothetical protein
MEEPEGRGYVVPLLIAGVLAICVANLMAICWVLFVCGYVLYLVVAF